MSIWNQDSKHLPIKNEKQDGGTTFLGQFEAFRGILEKCLLEEMCLELKIALNNDLKNVQEAFLLNSKNFLNTFETIF